MRRAKLIVILISVVLAVVIFLQNMEPVRTELLFATVTMPRAILLVVMLLLGFLSGFITRSLFVRKPLK